MSNAVIKTSYDPFLRQNPNGHIRKGSLCSLIDSQSDVISSLSEEMDPVNEDPSRINYFDMDTIPSTSISRSNSSGTDRFNVPQPTHQLTIDFTPVDGVDDDEIVVKKCNDFWDFVENNPKLNGFCVMPEPTYSSSVEEEEEASMDLHEEANLDNYPALCMMKNKQNFLADTFMTKAKKVYEPPPGDYSFSPGPTPLRRKTVDGTERLIGQFRVPDPAAVEVLRLCQEMEDWDSSLPKKLVSPRPASALIDAVLQRKP